MGNGEKESQKEPMVQEELEEEEINLLDYLRVIFKYRRMILLICGVAVVTTAIYSLLLPKIYSATASVVPPLEMLQTEQGIRDKFGGGGASMIASALGVTSIADLYAGILESRGVVDAIIDKFELMKVYEEKKYRSNVRKRLKGNTGIKISKEGILTITVEDRDPNRATAMANAYVEELDRRNKRFSSSSATSYREFVGNRLKEIEANFSNINDMPTWKATILETLNQTLAVEYEIAKMKEAKSMPTIQVLDEAVVPEIRYKPKRRQMVMLSAIVALFVALFAAFAREYFAKIKEVETGEQLGSQVKQREETAEDSDFDKLEGKRKIVASQRGKRGQKIKSYSQEAQTAQRK